MTVIALPNVGYQLTYPKLIDSVSISRTGNRAISFVETADPFWQVAMATEALSAADLALVEAFGDETRTGRKTVLYTPKHSCLPQAYWGNPGAAALANTGNLVSVTNGFTIAINSVDNGLTLMRGDLISLTTGDYHSLHRVQVGAVAALNAMSLTVEPFVPGYIAAGAIVRFKNPVLNTRVLPGSFSIPDEFHPAATFTLVEVPK
jgi:hypothetical protein